MAYSSGRQESDTSLLDTKDTSARKRFKRMYHRVRSGLERKGNVRLLTLTTSESARTQDFQRDFRKLIMRLKRRGLVTDYIRCPEKTKSGLRHDHILFRGSYIEQAYLSQLWGQIHNSPVVDIRRVYGRHRLACYLANYLAKAPSGRYSYSWAWVWKGFAKSWRFLKLCSRRTGQDYKALLTAWQRFVILDIRPDSNIGVFWLNKLWGVGYDQANQSMADLQ
ncbi:hypothetical protein ES703_118959 [subsurface metagenome]